MKRKEILESTFLISVNYSFSVIKIAAVSTSGVNIYLHGVSVYWPLSVLCVFVCVISNQSTNRKTHHVSDLSKLDTLLHKTHMKVFLAPRYQGSTWRGLSLSKIAHQIWHNHPFSQRNNTTERAVWFGVGGDREGEAGKNFK